jgi:hypothetical protein
VQDGFQARAGAGVGEHQGAHLGAVERSLRRGEGGAEFVQQGRHGGAVRRGEGVGDLVGVDDGRAARGEQVGDRGLAAADAAGETDRECGRNWAWCHVYPARRKVRAAGSPARSA